MDKIAIRQLKDLDRVNMTSFHCGEVYASVQELENLLNVKADYFGDEKVTYEFDLETETGIPFTIYDWKEGGIGTTWKVWFHIGTHTKEETEQVVNALKTNGLQARVYNLF